MLVEANPSRDNAEPGSNSVDHRGLTVRNDIMLGQN